MSGCVNCITSLQISCQRQCMAKTNAIKCLPVISKPLPGQFLNRATQDISILSQALQLRLIPRQHSSQPIGKRLAATHPDRRDIWCSLQPPTPPEKISASAKRQPDARPANHSSKEEMRLRPIKLGIRRNNPTEHQAHHNQHNCRRNQQRQFFQMSLHNNNILSAIFGKTWRWLAHRLQRI